MKGKEMNLLESAKKLKKEIGTLYYSYRDERTPLFAKVFSIFVVSYALSPIDLIPDFIPILGYLDDIILLPIGIYFALKMIPDVVIVDSRDRAEKEFMKDRKSNYFVAGVIVIIWFIIILEIAHIII
ncbi:conserved membrane protein of unknown function [Petrocella atlantisensis]|uniref:DUF1232 domain-containing protein n=1 Tax=Petrocella atlantisensis TaxID=2173034 RepID=A0A3P7PGJ5_9FIRM|nr:YkvA family protein [Petrocella atlantisensis]VDN49153.1 conserved membrane protein of unknown function [Petrocella atlantisensis]